MLIKWVIMDKEVKNINKIMSCPACTYKYKSFAQSLRNFALSHDGETVTFRNSGWSEPKTVRCYILVVILHREHDGMFMRLKYRQKLELVHNKADVFLNIFKGIIKTRQGVVTGGSRNL